MRSGDLVPLLTEIVNENSRSPRVGLLLSGGIDSLSVGLACSRAGKQVQAYTFRCDGYESRDCEVAQAISSHFGWPFKVVIVPVARAADDFRRLAVEYGCRTKVQYQVVFALLYVCPSIVEDEVWSGWNADDHYGNTRIALVERQRMINAGMCDDERKLRFDDARARVYASFDDPSSEDTFWRAERLFKRHGKRLLDPYVDPRVRDFFRPFPQDALCTLQKPLIRAALAPYLQGLPASIILSGVQLQKGCGIQETFERLLDEPSINRFEKPYDSIGALCQRWAGEIAAGTSFSAEEPVKPDAWYSMEQVRSASERAAFSVVSTFAGGGGSSIGYRLAGGHVLAAVEMVPEAARTYRANFPDTIVTTCNIRDITASSERTRDFLARLNIRQGDLDVLDGSPPCSEFSSLGKGISDQSVMKHYSSIKQSGIAALPFDFAELCLAMRPKVLVMENVPQIATTGKVILEGVLAELSGEYHANYKVLTATDFGVPQKRRRLFLVGVRKDVGAAVGVDRPEAILELFPAPRSRPISIRGAVAGLHQSAEDVWPWFRTMAGSSLAGDVKRLPKCPTKHTRLHHLYPAAIRNFTLTRCCWDLPAPTLTVMGQQPTGIAGALHPEHDRKFTILELKRLFGLPDDYALTGKLTDAAERICRMVPPFVTKAIAESLYERVLKPYREGAR